MADHVPLLKEQARALPESPGVYFWKDRRGVTLYIGKAVNLRARVTSYFSTARRDSRTRQLIQQARAIEHEVTATELEALIRESALIKEQLPRFNRQLRTPVTHYYFRIDRENLDPVVEIVRGTEEDGALYFGPFRTAPIARETLRYVHDILPLRKCAAMKPRCRPCVYYQMHRCAAPPLGGEYRERHEQAIARLFDLLDGRTDRVESWLEAKRDKLCESLLFERAAEVQDRLTAFREFIARQTILDAAIQCRCVVIAIPESARSPARLLLVAHGAVLSVIDAGNATPQTTYAWLRAHSPLLRVAAARPTELDAASVMERWLRQNRQRVRWAAVPHDATQDELMDRLTYVLDAVREPVAV